MSGLFIAGIAREMAKASAAQAAGSTASHSVSEVRSNVDVMQVDVEKLFLITEALWTILKEEHGYTDEELMRRIEQIDLRDGRLDGKVARQANPVCPQCGRVLIGKRPLCLYCGTPVVRDPFER